MRTVRVTRTLAAPIERTFDRLADHAGYGAFPGVRSARLVEPGEPAPNGVGAIREIDIGKAFFREEIVAYERPTRLDYRVLSSRPPVEHELGSIRLVTVGSGTEVTWTSTFRIRVPILGGLLTRLAARAMEKDFGRVLEAAGEQAR